jgi:hypothetical protein
MIIYIVLVLEVKYNLTIPEVASMTGDSIERLERVLKGVGCLGFNTYNRLRLNIDGLEQADYDIVQIKEIK